jgi:hypothetical protein
LIHKNEEMSFFKKSHDLNISKNTVKKKQF